VKVIHNTNSPYAIHLKRHYPTISSNTFNCSERLAFISCWDICICRRIGSYNILLLAFTQSKPSFIKIIDILGMKLILLNQHIQPIIIMLNNPEIFSLYTLAFLWFLFNWPKIELWRKALNKTIYSTQFLPTTFPLSDSIRFAHCSTILGVGEAFALSREIIHWINACSLVSSSTLVVMVRVDRESCPLIPWSRRLYGTLNSRDNGLILGFPLAEYAS
jgi:hypothetical protein